MQERECDRFDRALLLLPYALRERYRRVLRQDRLRAEELRLRSQSAPSLLLPDGEVSLGGAAVTADEIEKTLDIVTRASVHASAESIRMGFLAARGGYRIGLCGSAVTSCGRVDMLRSISSLCIRIPHAIPGVAGETAAALCPDGHAVSTLILSPPGAGKTTLLRDLVRILSDGAPGIRPHRVALADERGEIAAMCGGLPQNDVGTHTDVMDLCPKAQAVLMLLRAMNPEVVAVDEITAPEDAQALLAAAGCGAALLATAHGTDVRLLLRREPFRGLFAAGVFARVVTISVHGGRRIYTVEPMPEGDAEC